MNKTKIALAFALMFLLGAAAGGVAGASYTWHRLLTPPDAQALADRFGSRLQSQLRLTPEQAARIRPLLLPACQQAAAIRRDAVRQLNDGFDALDAQILAELSPEQRKEYREFKRSSRTIQSIKQAGAGGRAKNSP